MPRTWMDLQEVFLQLENILIKEVFTTPAILQIPWRNPKKRQ